MTTPDCGCGLRGSLFPLGLRGLLGGLPGGRRATEEMVPLGSGLTAVVLVNPVWGMRDSLDWGLFWIGTVGVKSCLGWDGPVLPVELALPLSLVAPWPPTWKGGSHVGSRGSGCRLGEAPGVPRGQVPGGGEAEVGG